MFRPSQALLRQMPALNKFLVHPPLPLNPRQSTQLLNLLITSFRQTLDKEHGLRTGPEGEAAAESVARHNGKARQRRHSTSDLSRRPTDQHIHSILTNPLFSVPPATQEPSTAGRDPMEVFDQAVAKGMMDVRSALGCLQETKRQIRRSAIPNVKEGMRDSGAGLKVLKWLVSSGTANDNDFLRDWKFSKIFMEFIAAEGLQEAAWKWIERAFEGSLRLSKLSGAERPASNRDLSSPLWYLVHAEIQGPVSLDAAYACLARAAEYLHGSSAEKSSTRELLGPAAKLIFDETTSSHFHPAPSESAFNSFIRLAPVLLLRRADYVLASLGLLHPTQPSADPALAYLKILDARQASSSVGEYLRIPRYVAQDIQLGLDSAGFLLHRKRFNDAEWIMQHLQTRYPKQLGLALGDQLEQAKADASTLHLLESLSLA